MLHAHALVKLSRRLRRELRNDTEVREFLRLRWPHGEVGYCEPVRDPGRTLSYLARHPATVVR